MHSNSIKLILTFLLFIGFTVLISDILLPFIVGIILAYFLDPLTDYLEKYINRTLAVILIILLFFLVISITSIILIPILYDQLLKLSHQIPFYAETINNKTRPIIDDLFSRFDYNQNELNIEKISSYFLSYITSLAKNLIESGVSLVNFFSLLFITPIVTFYMLKDWDRIIDKVKNWLPKKYKKDIIEQFLEIDKTISAYIRGQTNICLFLGIYYSILLTYLDLNFSIFIGFMTGILCFIPFVGIMFGLLTALIIGYFQFGVSYDLLFIALVFITGQIIEGNFITPKIMSDKIGLHPVWIIFGMLAGGSLIGFVGIIISIPVTAIFGVLFRFSINKYLKSDIYNS